MTITTRKRKKDGRNSYTVTVWNRYTKRQETVGTFWVKKDAEEHERQAYVDLQNKGRVESFKQIAVGELVERHLATKKGARIKPSTLAAYTTYLEHFTDFVGEQTLVSDIDVERVEQFITYLSVDKSMAPQTVNLIVQQVGALFRSAIRWRYARENPARQVENKPKRVRVRGVRALNPVELELLALHVHPHYQTMIRVWPYVAARPAEMFALRIKDYDAENQTLRIERQYRNGQFSGLKHDAKPRTVKVGARGATLIEAQIEANTDKSPEAPLFPTVTGRPIPQSAWGNKVFKKAVRAAGLPDDIAPHCMRHTGLTYMLESGASPMKVAQHAGHASPAITMSVYASVIKDPDDKAMDRMGDWLQGMIEASKVLKHVGNTSEVDSNQTVGIPTDAELASIEAAGREWMESFRRQKVADLIQLEEARQRSRFLAELEELREYLDPRDVDAIVAELSERGIAIGTVTGLQHSD